MSLCGVPRYLGAQRGAVAPHFESGDNLMARCQVCEKSILVGHNRSHSMHATRKVSRPNVFRRKVTIDGEKQVVRICTRCMRTQVKTA